MATGCHLVGRVICQERLVDDAYQEKSVQNVYRDLHGRKCHAEHDLRKQCGCVLQSRSNPRVIVKMISLEFAHGFVSIHFSSTHISSQSLNCVSCPMIDSVILNNRD